MATVRAEITPGCRMSSGRCDASVVVGSFDSMVESSNPGFNLKHWTGHILIVTSANITNLRVSGDFFVEILARDAQKNPD